MIKRFLLIIFTLFPLLAGAEGVKDKGPGVYLLISSYNPDTQRMSDFIMNIENSVTGMDPKAEIIIEDLGCKSFSEESFLWKNQMANVLKKFRNTRLKAIILLGQEAWAAFIQQDSIPENVPFFSAFTSVNGIELPKDSVGYDWFPESINTTAKASTLGLGGGYLIQYNVIENIRIIKKIYPQTNNIVFVSDNTYGGVSLQALIRKELKDYPGIRLTLLDGRSLTINEAEDIMKKLPPNSVVLLGTWRANKDGIGLTNTSLTKLEAANPKVPFFTISSTGFGTVAVGGYIPIYGAHADIVFSQITNYYKGFRDSVKFITGRCEYKFDKAMLEKFGIKESMLPQESIIIQNEDPRVRQYRTFAMVLSIISFGMLLLAVTLLVFHSRNKKLRIKLLEHEVELIEAKERAEESDNLKSAFLANMSHEIRTPLNAIVGFSNLLCTEDPDPEEKIRYNNFISKNSDILLTLISDILDISRLETDQIKFVYHNTDILSICNQVLNTIKHQSKPQIDYIVDPECKSYHIVTDPQRLTQVLINLATNANKFTEKGSITLKYVVDDKNKEVVFSVTDTGCGIPKEKHESVFQRFGKLNEFTQGTGLGLAICSQIVKRFGGRIWIDPEYTSGTRFCFSIPIVSST
ncbi:MAG: HAMP domain-containing sensor histidine kinase [Bacteroidales bacterium]|nr:HAMP domain-containing sensor histidine kinase [Bacteroidales bacterium]